MTTKITHGVTSFNAGQVIQSTYAEYTANASLGTAMPADDTIPQVTEGVEIFSQSFTPKYSTSKIRIRFEGSMCSSVADTHMGVALFKDGAANAIAAKHVTG